MDQSSSFLIELGFVFVFNIQNNRPSFQLWPDELSSGLLCPPSDHSFLSFWHCQSDPEIYEISSLLDIMSNTLQKPTWASPASFQLRISFISFGFSFFRFFGILSWTSLRVWKKWIRFRKPPKEFGKSELGSELDLKPVVNHGAVFPTELHKCWLCS